MFQYLLFALAAFTPASFCSAIPGGGHLQERSFSNGPVITQNFPDPSIIKVGGKWYSFATNNGNSPPSFHIQIAESNNFVTWNYIDKDAMPDMSNAKWSNGQNVWAPGVSQIGSKFVMYYTANTADGATHCVGAATASSIEGPYTPEATTIACLRSQGGAIDPAGFRDTDGKRYVVYKVDGNSIGHGGNCNNGVAPIVQTPILLQEMSSDGLRPVGSPIQILDRSDADGPLVEAPSLVYHRGTYVPFFSSNCYSGPYYDVSYATAPHVAGPYTKSSAPLLVTGSDDNRLYAPGGASVAPAGDRIVFHADHQQSSDVRQMWTATIKISGTTGSIA